MNLQGLGHISSGGCVFLKCVLPEELAKQLPKMREILDVWMCNGFGHVHMQERCKTNTPYAFKRVPDLF